MYIIYVIIVIFLFVISLKTSNIENFEIPKDNPTISDDNRFKKDEYQVKWKISELFLELLDRYPSMKEINKKIKQYNTGSSLNDIRKSIVASDEYQQLVKIQSNKVNDEVPLTLNTQQMKYEVSQIYKEVFGGKPDSTELDFFVQKYKDFGANKNQLREFMNTLPSSSAGFSMHVKDAYMTKNVRNKIASQIVCWFEESSRQFDKNSQTYSDDVQKEFENRLDTVYPQLSQYKSQIFTVVKKHATETNTPTIKSTTIKVVSYLKGVNVSISVQDKDTCRFSNDTLLTYPLESNKIGKEPKRPQDTTIENPIEDPLDKSSSNKKTKQFEQTKPTESQRETDNDETDEQDLNDSKNTVIYRPNITIYNSIPDDSASKKMKQKSEVSYTNKKSKENNTLSCPKTPQEAYLEKGPPRKENDSYLNEQRKTCGFNPKGFPKHYYQKRSLDELRMKCDREKNPYMNADKWGNLNEDERKGNIVQKKPPICTAPLQCDTQGLPTHLSLEAATLNDAKNTKVGSLIND